MNKPLASYRRIDRLKAIALERGFTNEDAKQFGKLSKTATWEALLELYLVDGESLDTMLDVTLDKKLDIVDKTVDTVDTLDWTNDGSFPVCFPRHNSSFLDWVDFGQFIALLLASAGVFLLAMNLWRQINPLNLFPPIKVNIQIGTKL